MNTQMKGAAKRLFLSLLLATGVSGCAYYSPPYAADTSYYGSNYGYSQPYYAGPPISLGLGFSFYDGHHGHGWYGGGHGWYGGGQRWHGGGHRWHGGGNRWHGGHRGHGGGYRGHGGRGGHGGGGRGGGHSRGGR